MTTCKVHAIVNLFLGITLLLQCPFSFSQEQFKSFVDQELDSIIEAERERWKVPGLSLGIFYNGEVLFNKGFGYANQKKDPITEKTTFMIGSLTKAMTTSAVFLAEEKGLLSVKDSIKKYLPSFNLGGNAHSGSLTVEDFFSGRTGLPAHWGDFLYWKTSKERKVVIDAINSCPDVRPLRDKFQYNNLAYMVLGTLLEKVSGQDWETYMTQNLFDALDMKNTYPNSHLAPFQHMAQPHYLKDGNITQLPPEHIQNMGPAGSVVSSTTDMLNWIREFIDLPENNSGLSSYVIRKMRRPYTYIGYRRTKETKAQNRFLMYGAGWSISDYNDVVSYRHDGGTDGFRSELLIIPELNFGVVVLSNSRSHELASGLVNLLEKQIYGLEETFDIDDLFNEFNQEKRNDLNAFKRDYALLKPDALFVDNVKEYHYMNDQYGTLMINSNFTEVEVFFKGHLIEKRGVLWVGKDLKLRCVFNENPEEYYDLEFVKTGDSLNLKIDDGGNTYTFHPIE